MFTEQIQRYRKTLAAAVLVLAVGGVVSARPAFARVTANTRSVIPSTCHRMKPLRRSAVASLNAARDAVAPRAQM